MKHRYGLYILHDAVFKWNTRLSMSLHGKQYLSPTDELIILRINKVLRSKTYRLLQDLNPPSRDIYQRLHEVSYWAQTFPNTHGRQKCAQNKQQTMNIHISYIKSRNQIGLNRRKNVLSGQVLSTSPLEYIKPPETRNNISIQNGV